MMVTTPSVSFYWFAMSGAFLQTHPVACVHPHGTESRGEEVNLQIHTKVHFNLKAVYGLLVKWSADEEKY